MSTKQVLMCDTCKKQTEADFPVAYGWLKIKPHGVHISDPAKVDETDFCSLHCAITYLEELENKKIKGIRELVGA